MAKSSSPLATAIIVALALVLLYALNPTREDFIAWRSGQAQRAASTGAESGLIGTLKRGASAVAGAMTGAAASGYGRRDYLVCSSYSLGRDEYLGIAHLFIKLK
jgi:hypothetical protein